MSVNHRFLKILLVDSCVFTMHQIRTLSTILWHFTYGAAPTELLLSCLGRNCAEKKGEVGRKVHEVHLIARDGVQTLWENFFLLGLNLCGQFGQEEVPSGWQFLPLVLPLYDNSWQEEVPSVWHFLPFGIARNPKKRAQKS